MFVCLFVHSFTYPFIRSFAYLFIRLSVCLFACFSVCFADSDFAKTVQEITILPNADDRGTPIVFDIVDDIILEDDEAFLALLELRSAEYPDLIDFDDSRLTLIRIRDNDSTCVGCVTL